MRFIILIDGKIADIGSVLTSITSLIVMLIYKPYIFSVLGAKIGHRSLMRYYKQRFGIQRALVPAHNQKAVGRVLKQYRALGWGGDFGKLCLLLWMRYRDESDTFVNMENDLFSHFVLNCILSFR